MAEEASALGFLHDEASFSSLLRISLLKLLDQGLQGAASEAASVHLRVVRDAVCLDAFDTALRNLDHAWRCLPDDAEALIPIYGRLLALHGQDHDAALGLAQRAADLAPDPEVAALIAMALLRLHRPKDARREIEAALSRYCVAPGGLLYHVAGEVIEHPGIAAPGWTGRGPNLEVVGELSPHHPANAVDIQFEGLGSLTALVRPQTGNGRRPFCCELPPGDVPSRLEVSVRGVPLLGSGTDAAIEFGLDGRAAADGTLISGWARLGWSPGETVHLRFEDELGASESVDTSRLACVGNRWPFRFDLNAGVLVGERIAISAQLPNGLWQALPDSPLLRDTAATLEGPAAAPLAAWDKNERRKYLAPGIIKRARVVDVIIPVHGAGAEALACIHSVLETLDEAAIIVVVDDASEDPSLVAALDALAAEDRIALIRHATNLGFVASVNEALALHPDHDAILLNSDTRVYFDWLARLRAAAYSGLAVGTVTPLSNNGSIASYPRALGTSIEPEVGAVLDSLAALTHPGIRLELPVGVGFCLYLRRDCLKDVGALDAEVFGKGYGEETDYCLRARARGWSHKLAADVFVYHAGALSFGARRAALLNRSQRLLNLRHPGFDGFVDSFLAQDPLQGVRRRLDEGRLRAFKGRFVLVVSLALTGGVERFVRERCARIRARGLFPLMLKAAEGGNSQRCELWTDAIDAPNLRYDIPADLADLTELLRDLPIESTEIQHFLHLDPRVIDAVRALPVPYDVFVHDYAWICPRITLIDGSGKYCGEPAVSVCETCVSRNGSVLGEAISVAALRERSAGWLRGARRVSAPSADTAERLQRHFEDLNVEVQPHSMPVLPKSRPPRKSDRKLAQVALIGAIGEHKGYQVLLACARDARARGLPIEFLVVGYTEDDAPLLETGKVFITGRYSDGEAPHLLQRERPDIAWLPSVWPETWCYTLDYALDAGLPVVAFDLGAIAERLRAVGQSDLLPQGLQPSRINDHLLTVAGRGNADFVTTSRYDQKLLSHTLEDTNTAAEHSDENLMNKRSVDMAADAIQLAQAQPEGLSASVQVLPLSAGMYLFSVKGSGVQAAASDGALALPAMHVGLGPGVLSGQVEFMEGPSTHGAWLFAATDLLVAKINSSSATLILTSVRAPGGDVLSIKVERLNLRSKPAALAAAAAPALAAAAAAVPVPAVPVPPAAAISASAATAAAVPAARASAEAQSPSVFGSAGDTPLNVQIGAHVRTRGDMNFADVSWAGRLGTGLWIESFSVQPLERLGAADIEYKALTGSGFETPWMSDDKPCGTKGMAVPLLAFALRLKPSPATEEYDCEYSGYFQSGLTVGPLLNGAPCRSTVANDPLEGIQIRLLKASRPRSAIRAP